jgi:hypothetical protein
MNARIAWLWIALSATSCQLPKTGEKTFSQVNTTSQQAVNIAPQLPVQHYSQPPQAPLKTTISVEILSEPEGSRIEINNEYVGKTPCAVEIPFYKDGRFRERTIINALPVSSGYTQAKVFH